MPTQNSGQITDETLRRVEGLLSQWNLSLDVVTELIEYSASGTFGKGDCVHLQGSTGDVAYLIVSGLVKVCCPLADGKRVVIKLAGPGDFVGTIDAVGTSGQRMQAFEAQAMTKVSVVIFARYRILTLLNNLAKPNLVALLEQLNTAWSELFLWCTRFLGLSFHDRLQRVFEDLAARFGVPDSRGMLLMPELSHGDLAEMIACSRPLITRLIGELVERGQLIRQGKRYILVRPTQAPVLTPSGLPPASKDHPSSKPQPVSHPSHMEVSRELPEKPKKPFIEGALGQIRPAATGMETGAKSQRPVERTLWESFVRDKRLQERYNITAAELEALSQVAMMGEAHASRDFLFMLKVIRKTRQR